MNIRYLRVSTKQQDHIREKYLLDGLGVQFDKTYSDVSTGKTIYRRGLQDLLIDARSGDIIYCESVSRLSRNINDLLRLIDYFIDNKIKVVFVKEQINTETPNCKELIKLFGHIAHTEREQIAERTKGKVEALKYEKETTGEIKTKSGKWFGRPEKVKEDLPKEFYEYYLKIKLGQLTKISAAALLGIGRSTLYRWIYIYEESSIKY